MMLLPILDFFNGQGTGRPAQALFG
jgi:hypothetical protein